MSSREIIRRELKRLHDDTGRNMEFLNLCGYHTLHVATTKTDQVFACPPNLTTVDSYRQFESVAVGFPYDQVKFHSPMRLVRWVRFAKSSPKQGQKDDERGVDFIFKIARDEEMMERVERVIGWERERLKAGLDS